MRDDEFIFSTTMFIVYLLVTYKEVNCNFDKEITSEVENLKRTC